MATVNEVLDIARSQIGYYALDDPEPGSKYGRWLANKWGEYWLAGPSTSIWWCCMWVSWVLDQAGQECTGFPSYNTDLVLGAGPSLVPAREARPGDIVIWDWDGNGATDHIGFVESYEGGRLVTIEGNYRNTVARVDRTSSMGLVSAVIRPPYDEAADVAPRRWDVSKGVDVYNGTGDAGFRGDETEAGFVICKASQGTYFRDAYAASFAQRALAAGKLLGFYHYAGTGDAVAEADWFVACCKDTGALGAATLWLDYEGKALTNGSAWAERFMARVDELTGKTCGLYASQSVTVSQDWMLSRHRPLWVAQYAGSHAEGPVTGWQDDPWTVGVFGAWGDSCAIHQYTGRGRVGGFDGYLDLDRGYFTREQWAAWATGTDLEPATADGPGLEVDGYWGKATTAALQKALGVTADGYIHHQWPTNTQPAFTTGWGYDRSGDGSETVRALQTKLGVHADGLIGPQTIRALQDAMGTVADGELWEASPCVKEMQRRLNAGSF